MRTSQTLLLSLLQLWIDPSAGGAVPAAAERKEKDFFAEHTQVVCLKATGSNGNVRLRGSF